MTKEIEERRIGIPWWVADAIDDLDTETFAITGGLGSGKTTGSACLFLDRWMFNKDSQFSWAVAPTHTKIEQIILPAIRQVLFDVYGMQEDVHYRIYKGKFFKLVAKGYQHEVHFLSADRPGLFVGSNIACLWVTEPGLMVREVYEKSQPRLRCPKAVVRQSIFEGTPEGVSGRGAWWAELADVPGVGYDRRGTVDMQRGVRRFIVETTFNRHLAPSPEEYAQRKIRDVYAYDKSKIKSYEKGLFVPFTKGTAYWEWVESRNLTSGVDPSPHLTVHLTWDFNVSPIAWVVVQEFTHQQAYYLPRTKKIVAVRESSGEARGLLDAVAEFAAMFPVAEYGDTPIEVDGDASGWARNLHSASSSYRLIEDYLRSLGYRKITVLAPRSNPEVRQRLEKTAALMAYERFIVDSRCVRLVKSYVKSSLKDGTFEFEKPSGEDWTHYAEACDYCLFRIAKDIDLARPNSRRVLGAAL